MDNIHLFELINAAPKPELWQLGLAMAFARWSIFLLPMGMTLAWIRGDQATRRELFEMLLDARGRLLEGALHRRTAHAGFDG